MAPRKKWLISTKLEKPAFFGFPKNLGQTSARIFPDPEKIQAFFGFPKNSTIFLAQIFREPEKWGFSSFVEIGHFFRGAIFRGHFFRGGGQSTPLPRVVMFLEGPYNALKRVL